MTLWFGVFLLAGAASASLHQLGLRGIPQTFAWSLRQRIEICYEFKRS